MGAGWQGDPTGKHQLRYHDGAKWTEHVSDNGVAGVDPIGNDAPLLPPTAAAAPVPPAGPSADAPVPAGQPSTKKPIWRRWWFLTGAAIVVLIVVGAALSSSPEDETDTDGAGDASSGSEAVDESNDASGDSESDNADGDGDGDGDEGDPGSESGDSDSDSDEGGESDDGSDSGLPDASDGPVPVGTALMEDDDVVRVNSISADVPVDDFFAPDPGFSVTTAEVEACGGDDGFNANAFYWTAFLDDNTSADNFLFADDFPTASLQPGACVRGVVSYQVPDGRTVASIVLTGPLFDETARWTADGAVPITERLDPVEKPALSELGEVVAFGSGHTAVAKSVLDATPPLTEFFEPGAGRQFSQIDVELCAGDESLPVNPLYWMTFTGDHWSGSAEAGSSTLTSIDVAPGQCVAGVVEVEAPEGSSTSYVVLTNPILDEVGRWSGG